MVRLMMGLVALACCGTFLSSAPAGQSPADSHLTTLKLLGEAYARDQELSLVAVELAAPAIIQSDVARWTADLELGLAVGYMPVGGKFRVIPWAQIRQFMSIEMARGRSLPDVVRAVALPGNIVRRVTWRFAGEDSVMSSAVFAPAGPLLFDTLLSLPVITGPVFASRHF
jgi:hypothetical protein